MTAKGKINASKVQVNDRIIVVRKSLGGIGPSGNKTGEGVQIARVIDKNFRSAQGRYEAQGRYVIETSAGTFEATAVTTMWLAPEDAAGIKRAYAEARAEQSARWAAGMDDIWDEALEEDAERSTAQAVLDMLDDTIERLESERKGHTLDTSTPLAQSLVDADHVEALVQDASSTLVTGDMSGSAVVELLENVWDKIRENHPDLPAVVMITGAGTVGASKWGHFRADGWKTRQKDGTTLHEMFMAGETLAKGATQVLQTMLHEGAHTLARVREIKDTSRQNRWHNQAFKKLAEEMGLEHKSEQADSAVGFSFVTLTEATKERYADLLADLDRDIRLVCHLPVWLGGEEDQGGEKITGKPTTKTGTSGNVKLTCGCEEPNIIRASKKVADKMVVRCEECDLLFKED